MRNAHLILVATWGLGLSFPASAFRSHSTDNEWQSTTISSLGNIGQLSENHVDQFMTDPSLPAENPRKFLVQFLGLNVMYSQDLAKTTDEFVKLTESRNSKNEGVSQTVDILNKVKGVFGRNLGAGLTTNLLTFKMGGVSIVPYANLNVDAGIHVPALPSAAVIGDAYAGIGIGYSRLLDFKSTKLSLGLNLRPGARGYAKADVDSSAIGDLSGSSQQTTQSSSSGVNKFGTFGVAYYLPVDFGIGFRPKPTLRFNLAIRDVGGAPALSVIEGNKPPVYPMRVNLGTAWNVWGNKQHSFFLATELQDLRNITEKSGLWFRWQWAGQYRYRLSFREQTSFGLNAGLQSGYPAIGAFLDLFIAKLEVARYTRETGYYIGQRPETRMSYRLVTQLTL